MPPIPSLYSYDKSVLKNKSYIVLGFYNHFLYEAAPNPGIELVVYAVLLLQSSNEPFEHFLQLILVVVWCFALAAIGIFVIASVDDLSVFVIGMPDLS